jgi:hypothetical protein
LVCLALCRLVCHPVRVSTPRAIVDAESALMIKGP